MYNWPNLIQIAIFANVHLSNIKIILQDIKCSDNRIPVYLSLSYQWEMIEHTNLPAISQFT